MTDEVYYFRGDVVGWADGEGGTIGDGFQGNLFPCGIRVR